MSNKAVVDSGVVLAYLRREPGWEALERTLAGTCWISAVTLAAVIAALRVEGVALATIEAILDRLGLTVVPFDAAQAHWAGERSGSTLSLETLACQALAATQGGTVVTREAVGTAPEGEKN